MSNQCSRKSTKFGRIWSKCWWRLHASSFLMVTDFYSSAFRSWIKDWIDDDIFHSICRGGEMGSEESLQLSIQWFSERVNQKEHGRNWFEFRNRIGLTCLIESYFVSSISFLSNYQLCTFWANLSLNCKHYQFFYMIKRLQIIAVII